MIAHDMLATIRRQIAESVAISEDEDGHISVSLPITYDDGDHCTCYAVRDNSGWSLRDYGDLVMRASYRDVNLLAKGYSNRLRNIAEFYGAKAEPSGELTIPIRNGEFGDAVFTFAQTCLAVQELAKTKPEKQRQLEDKFDTKVRAIIESHFKIFDHNWHDPVLDPDKVYGVDWRIPAPSAPWFVFQAKSPQTCLKATVTIDYYHRKQVNFRSVAVCKNEESLPDSSRIPLRDVADEWLAFGDGSPLERLVVEKLSGKS